MDEKIMRPYEVSFLAKSENGASVMIGHLTKFGAEISSEGEISEMELSYPIDNHESAYFGCMQCKIPTDAINGIHDAVNLDKEIMRVLIVTPLPDREKVEKSGTQTSSMDKKQVIKASSAKSKQDSVLSNDLLEEKLEEILK